MAKTKATTMSLPININELLHGTVVEGERIEFKQGWNDLDILHTICAFANDFSNMGGGYIIIGVTEREGRPVLPPVGLPATQVNKIQSELLNLCKQKLHPNYSPIVEPVTYMGKLILIIWCPGGQDRPYEAPERFVKDSPRHYYIRKFSNTVKPTKKEKEDLLRYSSIPFDDRINYRQSIKDLSRSLVGAFLQDIGSKLYEEFDNLPFEKVCRQMNLVEGPREHVKPKNFALMFFNKHPEKIFPMARIEVIDFNTKEGDKDFTELIFEGPIHYQLRDVLRYLKFQVIKEVVQKVDYQAEAIRSFNYPYEALEEILANAVFHRSYEIREPIEIRIHEDRIMIINHPGPDLSIKIEELQAGQVYIRRYRNRQIGNLLKDLKLTEGKCTDIPKILKALKKNNSPMPVFYTDEQRTALAVTLPIHKTFLDINGDLIKDLATMPGGQKSGQKGGQKTSQKINGTLTPRQLEVYKLIKENASISRKILAEFLNINESALRKHLDALKTKGFIKREGPDKGGYWKIIKKID